MGGQWATHFGELLHPIFFAYGWSDVTDQASSADMYVSFDAVSTPKGIQGTWLLYQMDFFSSNIQWPTYGGLLNGNDPIGCIAVKIVVASAGKNNSLTCQFAG